MGYWKLSITGVEVKVMPHGLWFMVLMVMVRCVPKCEGIQLHSLMTKNANGLSIRGHCCISTQSEIPYGEFRGGDCTMKAIMLYCAT